MAKSPLDVRLYRSSVKGRRPAAGDMAYGDLAINYHHDDPALIIKGDDNALIEFKPGAGVTVAAAAPATAKDGDLWWDTTSARLFLRYTSGTPAVSVWVDASPAAVPPALANALTYKGTIDPTVAASAPAKPGTGDTYVASRAGTADASWTGLAGQAVSLHELLVWDGTGWDGAGTAASQRTAWQGRVDITAAKPVGYVAAAGDLIEVSRIGTHHADWAAVPSGAVVGSILMFNGSSWVPISDQSLWLKINDALMPNNNHWPLNFNEGSEAEPGLTPVGDKPTGFYGGTFMGLGLSVGGACRLLATTRGLNIPTASYADNAAALAAKLVPGDTYRKPDGSLAVVATTVTTSAAVASQRTAWQGRVDITAAKPVGYVAAAGDLIEVSRIGTHHADWAAVPSGAVVGSILMFNGSSWVPISDQSLWLKINDALMPNNNHWPLNFNEGSEAEPGLTPVGDKPTGFYGGTFMGLGLSVGGACRLLATTRGLNIPTASYADNAAALAAKLVPGDTYRKPDGSLAVVATTVTAPGTSAVISGGITPVAALAVDCSLGNYFTKTVAADSAFTFSGAPAARSYAFTLKVIHTSGAITWPASVKWPGGTAPAPTAGKTHLFMFHTDDGGTSWHGSSLLNYTT